MSEYMKAEISATISSLGKSIGDKYLIEPHCFESIRDIIRYLRRDDEYHMVRRYLGEAKVLQNDLIPIVTATNDVSLFDIAIRLLVNLTSPILLLYKEEMPAEKVGRNLYLSLVAHTQEYKLAFCNIDFWTKVREKLTLLFETDWNERSEDDCLQIERLMVLLRNVLQVPADVDSENRPENDVTVHDKILWALRESQILELLLYIASNYYEDRFYLHLLEIFSLLLREQNPTLLAKCEIRRSAEEKEKDSSELARIREREKKMEKSYTNVRNFNATFVLKNVKSISDNEVIYHKSLDKLHDLKINQDKKRLKTPKNRVPLESERSERRSTFSVRLFLKEFCVELLSCSFNNLMRTVKDKLVSGRGLSNDESYYFWALKFFLEFSCVSNTDIKLISECINMETFHFIQMQMEKCYDMLVTDKKKIALWVRRLHLMLKAYRSLLQTLSWMDQSKDVSIAEISKVLKSKLFYVVEYRELMLNCLLKYDPYKFPNSFLRDLIEGNHLCLKLLEEHCKKNKVVVQKKMKRTMKKKKKNQPEPIVKTGFQIWEEIHGDLFGFLEKSEPVPEVAPFDAASSIPIDDQKEDAMKNVQRKLRAGDIKTAIGLFRAARQVWPENDFFGNNSMTADEETNALKEICQSELGINYQPELVQESSDSSEEEEEEVQYEEQTFNTKDYIKRLVNRKVIEGCGILLANYKKNTPNTNHCVVKLLHRIGWDCSMPSILYQASLFVTFEKVLSERDENLKEIQKFACHLFKRFRENAATNPKIFLELLFWKDTKIAFDIENGYGKSEEQQKHAGWAEEEEDELRRLWVEYENGEQRHVDRIDWIQENLISQSRTRVAIIKKLKSLFLIPPGMKFNKNKSNFNGNQNQPKNKRNNWSEEEEQELKQLHTDYQESDQVIDKIDWIQERLIDETRSRQVIIKKLKELSLIDPKTRVGKKKPDKKVQGWPRKEEEELEKLWKEYEETDQTTSRLDYIQDNLSNETRSRTAIMHKLKELNLMVADSSSDTDNDDNIKSNRPIDSDVSNSGDEVTKKPPTAINHPIDSDRSDLNGSDDDLTNKMKPKHRSGVLGSDSDDDEPQIAATFKQKRRRYIGSDSEVEGNASDNEEIDHRPKEIYKRPRMIGSDSECEGVADDKV